MSNTISNYPGQKEVSIDYAAEELARHFTEVEADSIYHFVISDSIIDEEGNMWFHLKGYSNGDGSVYRDHNLYEVRASGEIREYEPNDDRYWDNDWYQSPLESLYSSKDLLKLYFNKPRPTARFNKKTGELTSRYLHSIFPKGTHGYWKPKCIRKIWDHSEENPFCCAIAGNPPEDSE